MPRGNLAERTKSELHNNHESRQDYLGARQICHRMADGAAQNPWLTLVIGSGCATSESQENALLDKARSLRAFDPIPPLPRQIGEWPIGAAVAAFVIDVICDRLRLDEADVEARMQPRRTTASVEDPPGEPVPDWLFYLFAAAVLSTRLYFRIKSLTFEAPRRPDRADDAVLPVDAPALKEELDRELVTPCQRVLGLLLTKHVSQIVRGLAPHDVPDPLNAHDRNNLKHTVSEVLKQMSKGLTPMPDRPDVRVRLTELRALTEFAWFCFTKITKPAVYPGWSDLLLDLSNYDTAAGSVGTPLFPTISGAQDLISSRYAAATEESWRLTAQGGGGREGHYLAAARVLNAQHQYRKQFERKDGKRVETRGKQQGEGKDRVNSPPPTTAFVTSFDLELELSLLFLGAEFTVAMPVHVLNPMHHVAHTCWVGLRVPAGKPSLARLRLLREPEPGQWEILGKAAEERGPIVVRLAGCPLIHLPARLAPLKGSAPAFYDGLLAFVWEFLRLDVTANERSGVDHKKVLEKIRMSLELQHAIMINEHDAVLQSAIDLISIPNLSTDSSLALGRPGGGGGDPVHRGLPKSYAADSNRVSRFWMMLGVQIHDSAVRHRIATLISSLPITLEIANPDQQPPPRNLRRDESMSEPAQIPGVGMAGAHDGVAVNKHLTALEQDLLFWNGFDIVSADVSDFTPDLIHYASHLEQNEDFARGGRCLVLP